MATSDSLFHFSKMSIMNSLFCLLKPDNVVCYDILCKQMLVKKYPYHNSTLFISFVELVYYSIFMRFVKFLKGRYLPIRFNVLVWFHCSVQH